MLTTKEKGILLFIIEHCERIEAVNAGINEEDFYNNLDKKELSCFHIIQIGELAKGLSQEFLSKNNKMPWKNIKGMRDVIVHGYGTIKDKEVWEVVSKEIMPLHNYCQEIIDNN